MKKPDYKNWVPKGMIWTMAGVTAAAALGFVLFGVMGLVGWQRACFIGFGAALLVGGAFLIWSILSYCAFSYNGKRQLSRRIVEGTADYVTLPGGGVGLGVGCGSGALTIACAKRNPKATMVGIDRWGKEYASFSLPLCQQNAAAEGVANVRFQQGDAVRLKFPDEHFDAVISNYVYHNITGIDRQALLMETLRVLKKGGCFAIHDIFSHAKYGDMDAFVRRLREMGYAKVELVDTTHGRFMDRSEAVLLSLKGSALLVGRK